MTDWVPNTPNHPYYQKRNHVRLPKTAMSKNWIDNDAIAAAGGGGAPPVDPKIRYQFTITVAQASPTTNAGFNDDLGLGSIDPATISNVFIAALVTSASSSEVVLCFAVVPNQGYNGSAKLDGQDLVYLTVGETTVDMEWDNSVSRYESNFPTVGLDAFVGQTLNCEIYYTPEDVG